MQIEVTSASALRGAAVPGISASVTSVVGTNAFSAFHIIRRNGAVVAFEPNKIAVALMKAFLAVHGTQGAASASVRETVDGLTEAVVRALLRSRPGGGTFHIEDVQDHVELALMRSGPPRSRARLRALSRADARRNVPACSPTEATPVGEAVALTVIDKGVRQPLDFQGPAIPDRGGLCRSGR